MSELWASVVSQPPQPNNSPERRSKWPRITRDTFLIGVGAILTANEAINYRGQERPYLMMLFAGMMGLPVFFRSDEKKKEAASTASPPPQPQPGPAPSHWPPEWGVPPPYPYPPTPPPPTPPSPPTPHVPKEGESFT